jgi:uncharacterized protein (DUF885 family)
MYSDDIINADIVHCLSCPGKACAYDFGYVNIKYLEQHMLNKGYDIKDFYEWIYKMPLPIKILYQSMKNMSNKI